MYLPNMCWFHTSRAYTTYYSKIVIEISLLAARKSNAFFFFVFSYLIIMTPQFMNIVFIQILYCEFYI